MIRRHLQVLVPCLSLLLSCNPLLTVAAAPATVLVEAEGFGKLAGWVVDPQFMDQMGSPYLLAHGLGEPVRDATTSFSAGKPGRYRVWVRTREGVAPWKAPGAPGKFQVLVNGTVLQQTFGIEGAEWHWQDGGIVELGTENKLVL